MSNRVDFFQSEQTDLAIPAATASVFVDGCFCPYLVPMEIIRGGWPEFSWAKLTMLDIESSQVKCGDICSGKAICIKQHYNATPPSVAVHSLPLFSGQIDTIKTRPGPAGYEYEIIARDFSANMRRITVYGQRVLKSDDSCVMLSGLNAIFNPNGKANAGGEPVSLNGRMCRVFDVVGEQSKFWRYADVISYLLAQYLHVGQLQVPNNDRLASLTDNQIVRDLDVTGLNLLEALHRCCERIGLKFKFVPCLSETGPAQAIVFYRHGSSRAVEISCQRPGRRFSVTKTNVVDIHSSKGFQPVTHRYIGQGDFKVFESTFDLVKSWDSSLEDTDYDKFSPLTNPDFYQVKDVFRKWCLNEAGRYSDAPYSQGESFDFSKIFGTGDYIHGNRRFWPCLSRDKQNKSLGYFLQASFDGGTTWWQYLYAFNNLLDECGIWLSSDQLDLDTWIAAVKGVLKFRITASVISDERLTCSVADGSVNSTAPVIDHLLTLPRQFKYRNVTPTSIFYGNTNDNLGAPDHVDDGTALYEFIRHRAEIKKSIIEHAYIRTPYLAFDYQPGDHVYASHDSKDILSLKTDNRSICRIEQVRMDFEKQCTELKILRFRK